MIGRFRSGRETSHARFSSQDSLAQGPLPAPAADQDGAAGLGDVTDIVARLPGHKPSAASIYRLEQGDAIGVANARRVFDVVNAALNNTLDPGKELEMT